jgi:hypothetical protein
VKAKSKQGAKANQWQGKRETGEEERSERDGSRDKSRAKLGRALELLRRAGPGGKQTRELGREQRGDKCLKQTRYDHVDSIEESWT